MVAIEESDDFHREEKDGEKEESFDEGIKASSD